MKTQVVCNDHHIPYHDPKLLDMFVGFCKEVKPDEIHLLGDYQNCGTISMKFADAARDYRDHRLAWELGIGRTLLERLRDTFPKTDIHFHEGNHEWRLDRYIRTHAKALQGLDALEIGKLLRLENLKITHHAYGSLLKCGKLSLTHGDLVRSGSGATARAMLAKYGNSVLFGHTHRLGSAFRTDGRDTSAAWENGCMCRLEQPYTLGPTDWQAGWSLIHNDMKSRFQVVQVPVVNHRYVFEGHEYTHAKDTRFCQGIPAAKAG